MFKNSSGKTVVSLIIYLLFIYNPVSKTPFYHQYIYHRPLYGFLFTIVAAALVMLIVNGVWSLFRKNKRQSDDQ